MINLSLTDDQAKFLLIVIGNCASNSIGYDVYQLLYDQLGVCGYVPDPRFTDYKTIIVDKNELDSLKTR